MRAEEWKWARPSGRGESAGVEVRCEAGHCVEVETLEVGVESGHGPLTRWVRDSKLGVRSPALGFTEAEWQTFLEAVRAGEFD